LDFGRLREPGFSIGFQRPTTLKISVEFSAIYALNAQMDLPKPAYIDADGNRFHTVTSGFRIISRELISRQTLHYYALDLHVPPDVPKLRVIQRPIANGKNAVAGYYRPVKDRVLLEEQSLLRLRDRLQERGGADWRKLAARRTSQLVSAPGF
jgi:hypothetical protein